MSPALPAQRAARNIRPGYYWTPDSGAAQQARQPSRPPQTYEELLRDYHRMVLSLANKAGLEGADAEDAAQVVELRFWLRGGLEDYDPERLFEPPKEGWTDGCESVPRTAAFATMFKTFCLLSMRGERDRAARWYKRHVSEEETADCETADPAETICSADLAHTWVMRAQVRLVNVGQPEWAEALGEMASGGMTKREEWTRILGCKVKSCAWAQSEMRARLVAVGMGPESLARAG